MSGSDSSHIETDRDARDILACKRRIERLEQENTRLKVQLKQEQENDQSDLELALLKDISGAIVSELDLQRVLNLVVQKARELVDAETVLVPKISEDRQTYCYVAASGKNADAIINTCFPIRTGMCGWVMTNELPVLFGEGSVFEIDESTRWEKGQDSALLVPLFGKTRIIGGLSALGKRNGASFTRRDLDLFTLFANQVSIAIENASLVNSMQTMLDSLEQRVEARTSELVEINRELEFFCYSASHDLRTPLRGIDGYSHILIEEYADSLDDTARQYLQRIRVASQQMGVIIDALLRLSNVVRTPLKCESVNLSELAAVIVQHCRESDPERDVRIDIAPDLVCMGDPDLLKIALTNLIGNAWKYTSKSERAAIEVGGRMEEGNKTFFVSDNGCGFDMEYKDKLFEPFQRLHPVDSYDGTGVGLAITQRIISRHGGHIRGVSEAGTGATFSFTLPENKMK